jgi:hypothetical protein
MIVTFHQHFVRYADEQKGSWSRPVPINRPQVELTFRSFHHHSGTDELSETIERLIALRHARNCDHGQSQDVSIVFTPSDILSINHDNV